jgi:hypothetical protein
MLVIRYDSVYGHTVPDGLVEEYVNGACAVQTSQEDIILTIGSSVLLDAFRLSVKEGRLFHTNVSFEFQHSQQITLTIQHNTRGDLQEWPKGFCDTYDKILERLVDW